MRTAALLDEHGDLLDDSAANSALNTIGSRLADDDPARAREWMADLPEQQQPAAMRGFASRMVKADPLGFADMLASGPRNETWAAGVRVLVDELRASDREAAKQWEEQLHDAGY